MNSMRFKFKTSHANLTPFPQSHGHPAPKIAIIFALHNNRKYLFFTYIPNVKQSIWRQNMGYPLYTYTYNFTHQYITI